MENNNRDIVMEDRDTLIRVEQQLQDSIKNQSLILNDLKEMFSKIEIESKATVAVKSDLNMHLEMTTVRREDTERRFRSLEDRLKEAMQIKEELLIENTKLRDLLKDESKKITDETTDRKLFEKQVTTSIGLIKWLFGIVLVIISVVWPILTFVLDKKP